MPRRNRTAELGFEAIAIEVSATGHRMAEGSGALLGRWCHDGAQARAVIPRQDHYARLGHLPQYQITYTITVEIAGKGKGIAKNQIHTTWNARLPNHRKVGATI